MIIPLLLLPSVAAFGDIVTGCNSRCSIVFDDDVNCLNNSLNYHTGVLFGTMRNYVSAQVNIQKLSKSNNQVPLTGDQMVSATVNHISTINPSDNSDEKNVLSGSQAQPIIQALIDNVVDLGTAEFKKVYCPEGCEKPQSPWSTMFYASLSVNVAFLVVGIMSIILTWWQDIRYANKLAKKLDKLTPVANGN